MVKQRVASVSEIPNGKCKMVMLGGQPVALFNVDGTFFAIGDKCTHRGGLLHEGELEGHTITCPIHAGQFDITTGKNVGAPAPSPVPSYKTSVQGNDVFIET